MKKRFRQFTTLIMAVCMMVSLLCPAAHAAEDNVSPLVVSQGNRSIEYLPEENGYLLKNISAEEVFRAFDDDPYFVPVAATRSVAEQTASAAAFEQSALAVFEARGIDTTAARASTFEQDYYLPFSITGPDNSSVPAYFHACMKITTLSYEGKTYDAFVEVVGEANAYLRSGIYEIERSGPAVSKITYSGARLEVQQSLELSVAFAFSVGGTINSQWFSFGFTAGVGYIYRSKAMTYRSSYTLPLYNIVV
ncbi:MAG: hypothetical protein K2P20_00385 [Oscillospiraceae bacterium]|nr:hypothetical protein [Oscillospiraceae bacterium]